MNTDKLVVIWSSADPGVAHNVCFMYTHNAKRRGWFDDVTLIVWGPSAELAARDEAIAGPYPRDDRGRRNCRSLQGLLR